MSNPFWRRTVAIACFAVVCGASRIGLGAGDEVTYDGTFQMKRNGDCAIAVKFTMPAKVYVILKKEIANLHLLMRGLASSRAKVEVINKKPEWDDATNTLTFSMTALGLGKNMGTYWEVEVEKGAQYSNTNEAERSVFFNEVGNSPLGTVRGTTRVLLPEGARNIKWEDSRRIVSYSAPPPGGGGGGAGFSGLLIAALATLVVGVVLTGVSFAGKS
jgi:hypothetical protein